MRRSDNRCGSWADPPMTGLPMEGKEALQALISDGRER